MAWRITTQQVLMTRPSNKSSQFKETIRSITSSTKISSEIWPKYTNLHSTQPVLKHGSPLFTGHTERKRKQFIQERRSLQSCDRMLFFFVVDFSNTSSTVVLTVLLQNVQSSVHSLVETDRSGPCRHIALSVRAYRQKKKKNGMILFCQQMSITAIVVYSSHNCGSIAGGQRTSSQCASPPTVVL